MFAYCGNNPVMGYDPTGEWDIGTFFEGASLVSVGVLACMTALTVVTGGACAPLMAAAAATFVAGGITVANGASEIAESFTGYNVMRDGVYGGNTGAYEAQKTVFAAVAEIGTVALGMASQNPGLCFVAGTLVLAREGPKAIELIEAGDLVWAWDEETGDVALKEVVETYVNETSELVHIFVNGEEIITTPAHPFYSPVKGWTEAVRLRAGDVLVLVNGEYVVVEKVQHEILEAPITVYNFQLQDYHTYYVAETGVLVHNRCNGNWAEGGRGSGHNNSNYHFGKHGTEVGARTLEQYTTKATNYANQVLSKGIKGHYIPGATPNTFRYRYNGKYIDLAFNGIEHLLVSFGSQ